MGLKFPLAFLSNNDKISEGFQVFGHDTSYALIDSEKKQIFAFSTERISRFKHDEASSLQFFDFPQLFGNSLKINHACLDSGDPKKSFDRYFFERYNSEKIRKILSEDIYTKCKLTRFKKIIFIFLKNPAFFFRLIFERIFHVFSRKVKKYFNWYKHHLCHAVPAYFFSPFYGYKSLIFVLDGRGENEYSSLWISNENNVLELVSETKIEYLSSRNITSIGELYRIFTVILGFRGNSDEGKTEALAAYGCADESLYALCGKCYIVDGESLTWNHNLELIKKLQNTNFLKKELQRIGKENFAATIQKFLEDTVVEYLNAVYCKYPLEYLCLSGGTVANVIMNLHIYERTPFKKIYIFPAMGDDGVAFGSAILSGMKHGNDFSWLHEKVMPYWGTSYTRSEVLEELHNWSDQISWADASDVWPEIAAQCVSEGKIIAIFQGKMEFGPRALGNRSIIADPRDQKIREKMNLSIKRRPYFQPFCPSILESERQRLFENSYCNKHMTMAFRFKENMREILPSACHIDGTARPQFVEQSDNNNYFRLLSEMKRITGYGVVVNTSFNLHGRAMVMSPDQAIRDFLDCNLDCLFIEGYVVNRP